MNGLILRGLLRKTILISLFFCFVSFLKPLIESIALYRRPADQKIIINVGERHSADINREKPEIRPLEILGKEKFIEILEILKKRGLRAVVNLEVPSDGSQDVKIAQEMSLISPERRDLFLTLFSVANERRVDGTLRYNFADSRSLYFTTIQALLESLGQILNEVFLEFLNRDKSFQRFLLENGYASMSGSNLNVDLRRSLLFLSGDINNQYSRSLFERFKVASRPVINVFQRVVAKDFGTPFNLGKVTLNDILIEIDIALKKASQLVALQGLKKFTEVREEVLGYNNILQSVKRKYVDFSFRFISDLVLKMFEENDFAFIFKLMEAFNRLSNCLANLGCIDSAFSSLENSDIVITFFGNTHMRDLNQMAMALGFVPMIQEGDCLSVDVLKTVLPHFSIEKMAQTFARVKSVFGVEVHLCNKCFRDALKRCTRCRETWYCSLDCQRRDWPEHRKTCVAK